MNKKERRQADLKRHYEFLERFSEYLGHKQDGKKLSLKLLKIERAAHKAAEDRCNGDISEGAWPQFEYKFKRDVEILSGTDDIPGFFINDDPRGYALKIDDDMVRELPESLGFYKDWGGYGILSPEIGG